MHQNKVLTLKEFDPYQKILDILRVREIMFSPLTFILDPTMNLMNRLIMNVRE